MLFHRSLFWWNKADAGPAWFWLNWVKLSSVNGRIYKRKAVSIILQSACGGNGINYAFWTIGNESIFAAIVGGNVEIVTILRSRDSDSIFDIGDIVGAKNVGINS